MFIQSLFKYLCPILIFIFNPAYATGWSYYVGGSLNTSFPLKFYQLGWNEDNICYPNMSSCAGFGHKGFAWVYEVMSGLINPGLDVYVGIKTHKHWRIELSVGSFLSLQKPETQFKGLYYLKEDKNPFPDKTSFWNGLILPKTKDLTKSLTEVQLNENDSEYISSENSFSNFHLTTGLANVYFDLPIENGNLTPYFGLGFGYTLIKANIQFQSKYKNNSLNSKQDDSFTSLSLTARLKAGLNYVFSNKISYGLEVSYTMLKGASDNLLYQKHPNQKNNMSTIRDIRYLKTAFNVIYLF